VARYTNQHQLLYRLMTRTTVRVRVRVGSQHINSRMTNDSRIIDVRVRVRVRVGISTPAAL
jgi:hypothetical protein